MEKFHMVVSAEGKSIIARNAVDFDKAERAAKKAVADYHDDMYILTTTHVVRNPTPDLKTETIQ